MMDGVHANRAYCLVLISGGARSGKSAFAEALARAIGGIRGSAGTPAYIATGQAMDPEFEARIAAHRRRRGTHFVTYEAPLELKAAMERAFKTHDIALVECFSTWLGNLYHHLDAEEIEARCEALVRYCRCCGSPDDPSGSDDLQSLALGFLYDQEAVFADLGRTAGAADKILIGVTSETGLGVIPAHAAGRRYRDDLGWLNQQLAAMASAVFFSVAGIPRRIK